MTEDQTTSRAAVDAAVRAMNGALRAKYHEIRQMLHFATASDARDRYRIATTVREIKHEEKRYGERAIPLLARALSRTESTLYRYALVAETWDEPAFEAMLSRRILGNGEPLSWSHLLIVAAAPPEDRDRLVAETIAQGLSVRALTELARDTETIAPDSGGTGRVFMRFDRITSACDAFERIVIDDTYVDRIVSAPRAPARLALRATLDALERLQARIEIHREKLQVAEQRLNKKQGETSEEERESDVADLEWPEGRPSPRLVFGYVPNSKP